jgi:hypothetical protein
MEDFKTKRRGRRRRFGTCPFCRASLLIDNIKEHIKRVHGSVSILEGSSKSCAICGSPMTAGIDPRLVCDNHSIIDARSYIIPQLYLPLKQMNNKMLTEQNEIVSDIIFHHFPLHLNTMSTQNTDNTYDEMALYGYWLLRAMEVIPEINAKHPVLAKRPITPFPKCQYLNQRIRAEYELMKVILYSGVGFFQCIIEENSGRADFVIIPNLSMQITERVLQLYLRDYQAIWRRHQQNLLWPSDFISASDFHGCWFHIDCQTFIETSTDFSTIWRKHSSLS